MAVARWTATGGWDPVTVSDRHPLPLDPATAVLHYGQSVIEGLKAHRRADGSTAIFRPRAYASRMRDSARRLAMPEPPEDLFMDAVVQVARHDGGCLPDDPDLSLYLRPVMFADEPSLALRPSHSYRFLVLAFITGGYFAGAAAEPIAVTTSERYVRAAPGGTGAAKYAGNYAPTYLAQRGAIAAGYHEVVWLDAMERAYVEELSGMNLFFVRTDGAEQIITTPPLTGTLLPGVTRSSILALAPDMGYRVEERPVRVAEWRDGCQNGEITETFACGTAAILTPIGKVSASGEHWTVGDGRPGPVTLALRAALRGIQRGTAPDPFGWMHPVA
jgi:branched-chain amino acid aminotransferase